MDAVRLMIADDHKIFRKSLIKLIGGFDYNFVLSEASNGSEVVDLLTSSPADILLLDIQMPGMDGVEVLKQIRRKGIATRVIVLTQFDENVLVAYLMQLGACAFLNKNCEPQELERAISAVLHDGFYQSEKTINGMRTALDPTHPRLDISPRDRQMIALLRDGKSNKEIARAQGLALHTIETYRKALLKKTQCKNVTELIALAYRTGLL